MVARWRFEAAGALIVSAAIGQADLAWLNSLRRRHYPPERNRLPAHLTLFRTLPPSSEDEVRRSLARAAAAPEPDAAVRGAIDLDSGVALRIESRALERIREELADEFRGLLTAQDLGPWTPHVTIQNKVEPRIARRLLEEVRRTFEPRPVRIAGLELNRYLAGDWERLGTYRFRG